MKQVLMIVLNSCVNDARVLKMATTLSEHYHVDIFARRTRDVPGRQTLGDVTIQRHSVLVDRGPWTGRRPLRYIELLIRYLAAAVRMRPAFVHAHDLNALPIGYIISKLTRAKLVYDAHELWSEREVQHTLPRYIRGIGNWFERRFSRKADAVLTVSDGIASEMQGRLALKKVNVVRNLPRHGPVDRNASPLRPYLSIDSHDFVVLYQGALSAGRGIECLIQAVLQLKDPRIQLVVLGDGPLRTELEALVSSDDLGGKIHFISAVPHAELLHWTAGADIGVHPMVGSCLNHKLALPNKLFEYVHAGLPVVVSDMPEMAAFVHREEIGLVFEDGNAAELAEKIVMLCEDQGVMDACRDEALRVAAIENWEVESAILESIYGELVEGVSLKK